MAAHAINDRGQIVGIAQAKDGRYHFFPWDREHGMQDRGVTGDARFDINNSGQIAGAMRDPNGNQQACLWEPGKPARLLGTLGGKASQGAAINNRCQIAGVSDMPDGSQHAFFWDQAHGMRDLGTLGDRESYANAINDANQIVFRATPSARSRWIPAWIRRRLSAPRARCYLWDPNHGKIRLDPYLGAHRTESFISTDINSKGCIIGVLASGPHMSHRRSILLEPIPKRWGR
jgi:probable HAF family extracellular repeat protein